MTDDAEHRLDGTCWCQPVLDHEDPVTGGRVYVHRRYLDGPAYEPRTNDDDGSTVTHYEGEPTT